MGDSKVFKVESRPQKKLEEDEVRPSYFPEVLRFASESIVDLVTSTHSNSKAAIEKWVKE